MTKCICLSLFLLLSVFTLHAQTDSTRRKLVYWNNMMIGGLFANQNRGNTVMFATTHGVRIGRFATGLGVGLDYYTNWRMVPLFASASFDVIRVDKSSVYLQVNGGYSFSSNTEYGEGVPQYDSKGGAMINPMIGYRLRVDKLQLYAAVGYKYQRNDYDFIPPFTIWSSPGPQYSVEEDLNRLVITFGFGLN